MNDKWRLIVPPIVPLAARKMVEALHLRKAAPIDNPEAAAKLRWCPIQSGPLAGRSLYMNPEAQAYQATMLQGTYDQFLFDYIDRTNWSGKVIYDIGAHIGYHTLNFAHRVGSEGRVFSFEPHPSHVERINVNLSHNADLASRVTLIPVAIANSAGRLGFLCTESLEMGGSSGSHIEQASTPWPKSHYAPYFQGIEVEAARLDDLVATGRCLPPDLVKIDVEGAESLVVEGALDTLRKYKPIMVIEVHSILNMLRLTTLLLSLGYSFNLLEEAEQRCFVSVEPPDPRMEGAC